MSISLKVILLTCIICFKKVHLLLEEGVEQQMLESPVEPRQGAHEDAPSQPREESAVNTLTLFVKTHREQSQE